MQRLGGVGLLLALLSAATFGTSGSFASSLIQALVVAWGGLAVGGVVLTAACAVGVLAVSAPRTDVTLLQTQVSWVVPVLGLSLVAAVIAYVTGIALVRIDPPTQDSDESGCRAASSPATALGRAGPRVEEHPACAS